MEFKKIIQQKIILKKLFPNLNDKSGIYIMKREEGGFRYGYVGQAKHILTRLASHMLGKEMHIDKSLLKHGLYSDKNPHGWNIGFINCHEEELDEKEQHYIALYANAGYQMRNKTSGSQGVGKQAINDYKPAKGYHDGLKQGYKNAQKFVAGLFEKNLTFSIKGKAGVRNKKAYDKFEGFLKGDNNI